MLENSRRDEWRTTQFTEEVMDGLAAGEQMFQMNRLAKEATEAGRQQNYKWLFEMTDTRNITADCV